VCQSWIVRDHKRHADQLRCEKEANKYFPVVQELQKKIGQRTAALTAYQQKTDHELMQLNLQLKNLNEKIKSNEMRLMNYKNQLEWITMAVRSHLRRKSIVESTTANLFRKFCWNLYLFHYFHFSREDGGHDESVGVDCSRSNRGTCLEILWQSRSRSYVRCALTQVNRIIFQLSQRTEALKKSPALSRGSSNRH
jgi:hypothetical protein